jgi:thiamine biosynthesis lipoprotein
LKNKLKHSPSTSFEAIGTHWKIDLLASVLSDNEHRLLWDAIDRRIEQFDRDYSRFRADSLITKMSLEAGSYRLPSDAEPLFDLYQKLYELTEGCMTPLIGQLLSDAGYDANYRLTPKKLSAVAHWEEIMSYHYPTLTLTKPALLDVGAAGKGYLVDIVAEIIGAHDIKAFVIDAGGDILHRDADRLLNVGLEHPNDSSQVIGIANFSNRSLCGSAGNRRAWGAFHHIMNPQNKLPADRYASVWIVADSTLLADGLSTAVYFCDVNTLHKWYDFEYALLYPDFSLEYSKDFPASFYSND